MLGGGWRGGEHARGRVGEGRGQQSFITSGGAVCKEWFRVSCCGLGPLSGFWLNRGCGCGGSPSMLVGAPLQVLLEPQPGLMGSCVEVEVTSASRWSVKGQLKQVLFSPATGTTAQQQAQQQDTQQQQQQGVQDVKQQQQQVAVTAAEGKADGVARVRVSATATVAAAVKVDQPGTCGADCTCSGSATAAGAVALSPSPAGPCSSSEDCGCSAAAVTAAGIVADSKKRNSSQEGSCSSTNSSSIGSCSPGSTQQQPQHVCCGGSSACTDSLPSAAAAAGGVAAIAEAAVAVSEQQKLKQGVEEQEPIAVSSRSHSSTVAGAGSSGDRSSRGVLLSVGLVLLMVGSSVAGLWVLVLLAAQTAAQYGVFMGQQPPVTPDGPLPECTLKWS